MAYQDIADLLLSEAKEKADSILSAASDQASELLDSAKKSAAQYVSDQKKIAEDEKFAIEKKGKTEESQFERSARALMQQEVIDAVYIDLKKKLSEASSEEKIKLFSQLLSLVESDEGKIISLGEEEKVLKSALKDAGKKFNIESAIDSSRGGFLFEGKTFDMDFSFDSLLSSSVKPKYESEIFQKLFA